ncbi:hypothetical protein FNV43_RR16023 [Rhamnella rubrinervis]|uniref:Prolamin-like domain-containing protein n=1 Tax=Rhamnella rubrinervis TaxID=2594499 RepID=A0A8K0GUT6_9ROSA|nr:hypothetical protein FNV43_RR16023 [Rhamnella rubrinervis]
MAKLMSFMSPLMVILILGSNTVTILPGHAIPTPAPAPTSYKFLQDCAAKLGDCGYEIYSGVFSNGTVTNKCCTALVLTGEECHDDLVEHILTDTDFKGNATEILERSQQVWNGCVPSVAPAAFTLFFED